MCSIAYGWFCGCFAVGVEERGLGKGGGGRGVCLEQGVLTGFVGREEIILSNGNCRFRDKSARRPSRSVGGGG